MLLVDTSVWIDYLRQADHALKDILNADAVIIHPFIIGELAIGHLRDRQAVLQMLNELPRSVVAAYDEVIRFIDRHQLFGSGIGYVDASLLASTQLTFGAKIWTRDKRLLHAARRLSLAATPVH